VQQEQPTQELIPEHIFLLTFLDSYDPDCSTGLSIGFGRSQRAWKKKESGGKGVPKILVSKEELI